MEDRIENVVEHELKQCQQSDEQFYTVRTQDDSTHEILAELCHLEPSDVEMHNEWRGTINTGPLMWSAAEDQDKRTVFVTRVAWAELDRAMDHAGSDDVEELQQAEEHFATAVDQYGDSAWVRLQRLDNRLELQAQTRSDDDEQLLGDDVADHVDEVVGWANDEDKPEAVAEARLMVVDHLREYIRRQESSIDSLGARDNHIQSAAEAAEEDDDEEAAEEYWEELEELRETRPERRETLENRVERAAREGCGYVDQLRSASVEDEELGERIDATIDSFDCEVLDSELAEEEEN